MPHQSKVADYSNEDPTKVLNSYSLIEAIHEYFSPTIGHEWDYLNLRINLLRNVFELGRDSENPNAEVIEQLLNGYGKLSSLQILPFEGALEVPNSIDTEAHRVIGKQYDKEIQQIRKNFWEIQNAYVTYLVIQGVAPHCRTKTVTVGELIAAGLPSFDPGQDEEDY